jgi:hypothetical protein
MSGVFKKVKDLINFKHYINEASKNLQYKSRVNFLDYLVVTDTSLGISEEIEYSSKFVVSLTTYDKRLHDVYLTIESLMQQTRKADKIILWLSQSLINDPIPMSLKRQQNRGLEIKYCSDIKSYKKLIPTLKCFPNEVIITVDDDVIYNNDMLDKLICAYITDPQFIYYNRGHKMKLLSSNTLDTYVNWDWCCPTSNESKLLFPTGVGGILYPPNSLDDEVFNESIFMDICGSADDVWFKAMALKKGTLAKKVYTRDDKGEEYLENESMQDIALGKLNNIQNQNDRQIKAVFDKYDLYKFLK